MHEEDFACEKFQPQKWRKDVCRNCYQSLRLHEKKKETTPPPHGAAAKPEPKVFQRYKVNREKGIDHSVPARERTQPQTLEGVQSGKVAGITGMAVA